MHNSQELAKNIKSTAKSKKIAIGKMLSDCELSINTLSSMQSGGYFPRLEAIVKIADYLECSVDYLLGKEKVPAADSNGYASEFEKLFARLTAEQQALVISQIKGILQNQE